MPKPADKRDPHLNTSFASASDWDDFVSRQPRGHVLQLAAWGQLKGQFGWEAHRIGAYDSDGERAALVLTRPLPFGLGKMAYVPMGGYASDARQYRLLWREIQRKTGAAFLKVEPGILPESESLDMRAMGFRPSPHRIQPPRTIIIDINENDSAILGRMNQGTRRKIRKSLKSEVRIRAGTRRDLPAFCHLMQETGARNNFGVHNAAYFEQVYELFMPHCGEMLLAERDGELLAALMVFALSETAWYLYGASARTAGNLYASYGIQWAAIQWAKKRGCRFYDMWGAPDHDEAALEAQFRERSDGLWGVYGFKRGWGGELRRGLGAWDKPFNPAVYWAYRAALRVKNRGEVGA